MTKKITVQVTVGDIPPYTHYGTPEAIKATSEKLAKRRHVKLTEEEQREVMRRGGDLRRVQKAMQDKATEVWRSCKARKLGYDDTLDEIARICGVSKFRAQGLAKRARAEKS